jgi:NitT/TauT family transport system substrate-binding protein
MPSEEKQMAWRLALTLALLAVCVQACAPASGSPAPPAASAPAPAQPGGGPAAATGADASGAAAPRALQSVSIATTEPQDMAWIIFGIAVESGIAAREGYALELLSATTNVAIPAIMSGEMGYTAQIASGMRAGAQGADLRGVAFFMDAPLQSLVVRPEFRQVSDLVGRSIGVSTSGATAHTATVYMMESLGVREEQVNWVFLGAQSARYAALEQNLVQAAALNAPLDRQAERDGSYRILVRAADVVRIPFVGLATSTSRIQERRDEVKGVLRAVLRTMDFIRQQPEEANASAARWLKTDDMDLIRPSMDQVRAVLTPAGAPDPAGFHHELEVIAKLANLPAPPRPEQVTDFRLLEEVQRELGLPVGALRN